MRLPALLLFLALTSIAKPNRAQVPSTEIAASPKPAGEQANEPSQPIGLKSPDREISRRLSGLFEEIEDLNQVRAEVDGGVVRLTGTTLTAKSRQQAESIAARLAGVASVQNDVRLEYRVDKRLQSFLSGFKDIVGQVLAFLPLFLISLLVFLAFWGIGRLITRSNRIFGRIAPNLLVQTLVSQVIRLAFILVGLVLAMRIMGATALLGSVLGAAGVLGLAIGFAVRDTIENYIASILLSVRRPFAPNDHVIVEGFEGRVTRLNSRATFLTSFDGNELRIPNAIVYKAKITNFSQIPQRRFEFDVGIGYENDLCHALAVAASAVKGSKGVLKDPEPFVLVENLAASTIALKVFGWVDQRTSDFGKVRGQAIRTVKESLDAQNISMPAPIQINREFERPHKGGDEGPSGLPRNADVADTTPDRSLEKRVKVLRSNAGEDLLTPEAPRE